MVKKDMYGKSIRNGEFLAEGHEDHAYIFQLKDNKPVLVALLGWGYLKQFSLDTILENDKALQEGIENGHVPPFMRDYHKTTYNRLSNIKTESLCISRTHNQIISKFLREGYERIEINNDYDNSKIVAYFPEEEVVENI